MPEIKPFVGQIVYYKARGSADGVFPKVDRAAIVTDVQETFDSGVATGQFEVRVAVLNPEGLFFSAWLKKGQEGGEWDYISLAQ